MTTLSPLPHPAHIPARSLLCRTGITLALLASTALLPAPSHAETHLVRMLNRNSTGSMVYEPDFLKIKPGDRVKFLASSNGHDAVSIAGMAPAGAKPFKGRINEEIEVHFEHPGLYGVKCLPHYAMGMVMLIQVGEADPRQLQIPAEVPERARKRFTGIVERTSAQHARSADNGVHLP